MPTRHIDAGDLAPLMRVAGIDWATEPKNRALVELHLDSQTRRVRVDGITCPLSEGEVARTVRGPELSVVGVDVPFGWPRPFAQFVGEWSPARRMDIGEIPPTKQFAYRATDLFVRETVGKKPLSVSSDRIGLGALAWARLAATCDLFDRIDWGRGRAGADGPTIIEVYPAASLASWARTSELGVDRYKKDSEVRGILLNVLFDLFKVEVSPSDASRLVSTGEDSDKTDAFIAALTALIYTGRIGKGVHRPAAELLERVRSEGWIYFPV